MNLVKKTVVAAALGTVVVGSAFAAQAQANPFGYSQMESGYQLVDGEGKCGGDMKKAKEGKCGEGKCGGDMKKAKEGKCGEGKCGGDMKKAKEGKCGEGKCGGDMKKAKEGKCGEGKCGGDK